ncbi:DNA primase [Candidatus Saccharibacteria bacterium TM7i]|nr:DNA primase [Candidatus Saccharibacteria bacterium TM7i]
MQDAKEEIRARLNIEDVVGEYVQLKRAGRNFKGLSPFSAEKTPSFIVSPEKNIWHDFSSNKGGDVFSFVMEVEGTDFRGALEILAQKAGVDLSAQNSQQAQENAKKKRRLLEAHVLAARYFQQSLLQNQTALEYVFKKRNLSKEVVQDFQIGYAPDSGAALVQFLNRKGFTKRELDESGLVNRFGGDLFRGRMTVPLMDASGKVIGFTGRILTDEPNAPKYLNTPQTLLYDKSRHVFGLSQAKEAIRKNDYVVVVEGNLDVVSSHQVGVKAVVATAGTAMTEQHLKALVRLSPNIKLAFDADAAGLAATERAIPIAQNVGAELTIVSLPDDVKDPDELIQKDVSLWQRAIDTSEAVVDWLFRQYAARENMETPAGRRDFTTAALKVVRRLDDVVEQKAYVKKIARYVEMSEGTIAEKLATGEVPEEVQLKEVRAVPLQRPQPRSNHDTLLSIAAVDPEVRPLLGSLVYEHFITDEQVELLKYLQTSTEVLQEVPKELQDYENYVKIILLQADTRYGQWESKDRALEAARLVRLIITEHKKKQIQVLNEQLRVAQDTGDDAEATRLMRALNELIKETTRAKR